jgi:prevent-host-death family protein
MARGARALEHSVFAPCGYMCYAASMSSSVSVRELRNKVSEVLRRVEGGERVTVTVDRRPVAELVPLRRRRAQPVAQAQMVASRYAADRGLLADLRKQLLDTTDEV